MKRFIILIALLLPLACAARQLRPLVWVLDAGHGGKDQGTSLNKVLEKDLTLQLTNRVAALIRKNKPGIKVVLTRTDDTFVSLEDRCKIASNARADLFLSIHINFAGQNLLLSGTETFYASKKGAQNMVQASHIERNADNSQLLAWLLQNSYFNSGRPADRGARASNLYVLMHAEMPAVLTEVGFLSNRNDAAYMCSERGQKQIALDIYNALEAYYDVTKAKTQRKTLRSLRQSRGTVSGLKKSRVRQASSAEDLMPMQDPFAKSDQPVVPIAVAPAEDETPAVEEVAEVVLDAVEDAADEVESDVADNAEELATVTPAKDVEVAAEPVKTEVVKPVKKEEKPTQQAEKPVQKAEEKPLFSVQLFAVSKALEEKDPRLKGLAPVKIIRAGAAFKVLYGSTPDYNEAKATLKRIKEKFPDAFIVAYVGERSVSTAEALQMQR